MSTETDNSLTAIEIATNALRRIREDANKALVITDDGDSNISTLVTTERKFELLPADFSSMKYDKDNVTEAQTPFDANFTVARSPVDMSVGIAIPGTSNDAIDREIQQLHSSLNAEPDKNLTLQNINRKLKDLRQVAENSAYHRAPQSNTNRRLSLYELAFETPYGQNTRDMRSQRASAINFLPLKDDQNAIPEIDGANENRVKKFLNASSYATRNTHPAVEHTLRKDIPRTRFEGKAMTNPQAREIHTLERLKRELEHERLERGSTAYLQLELNSLKRKTQQKRAQRHTSLTER
jgi:hypothetical protein